MKVYTLTPSPYPLKLFPWTFPNVPFPSSLPSNHLISSNWTDTRIREYQLMKMREKAGKYTSEGE